MRLVVVTAGSGTPSSTRLLGDRLADATLAAVGDGERWEVTHLELRELATDLASAMTTHLPSARLRAAFESVGTAAGVIAVTPILNGSYAGLFKLFFDLLDEGVLRGRPVLLAATGGTARHSLVIDQAMLPLFFYLKARVAPTTVFAATDDWGDAHAGLSGRIAQAGRDLSELMAACPATDHADEFADVPDFAQLLGR